MYLLQENVFYQDIDALGISFPFPVAKLLDEMLKFTELD